MLDRILQNFTWKDWCSKWELTYAFFHTFPTSFFPRSKLKFFHGLSVSVFFSRRTWTPRISTSCCCSISMRLTKTGPRKLESNSSRWHLGYGELESNSTWWHTYIYIYIYNIYNIYIYTPPRMQLWYRKVLLGIPAIPDLAFWVRVTSKICPIGNWHYPLSAGTSAKLPGGGGTGEYPCISSCRA